MLVALLAFYWGMTINSEVIAVTLMEVLSLEHNNLFSGIWLLSILLCLLSILILSIYLIGLVMITILRVFTVRYN